MEGFKHLAFYLVRLSLPYPIPLLSSLLVSALAYFVCLDLPCVVLLTVLMISLKLEIVNMAISPKIEMLF